MGMNLKVRRDRGNSKQPPHTHTHKPPPPTHTQTHTHTNSSIKEKYISLLNHFHTFIKMIHSDSSVLLKLVTYSVIDAIFSSFFSECVRA